MILWKTPVDPWFLKLRELLKVREYHVILSYIQVMWLNNQCASGHWQYYMVNCMILAKYLIWCLDGYWLSNWHIFVVHIVRRIKQ